jgi:hypothetical protein
VTAVARLSRLSEGRQAPEEDDGPARDLVIRTQERRSGLAMVAAAGLALLLIALGAGAVSLHLLPKFPNPFGEETKDRSQPVLLRSLQDLSRYESASGSFEVIVDLEQDAKFLPDAAYVDFGGLRSGAVTVSSDRRTAAVRLQHAQLEQVALDTSRSRVFAEQRGLLDRIGSFFSSNPDSQQKLYQLAQDKIQAAAAQSELRTRAEANARTMVEGMLRALGFTRVTVTFA